MDNFDQFKAEVDAEVRRWHDGLIVRAHRTAVLDLFRRLIQKTPRLTGRAAMNWNVQDGSPSDAVFDYDGPAGSAGSVAMSREEAAIEGAEAPGITWVANNLPYIEALNNGHSRQAPAGFVEVSLEETRRTVERFEGV